VHLSFIALLMK